MPKKEHLFTGGAGFLLIAALVVAIVFIVLWSQTRKRPRNCPPPDCPDENILECIQKAKTCGTQGCEEFCENNSPETYDCGPLCPSIGSEVSDCDKIRYDGCVRICKQVKPNINCEDYCFSLNL